MAAAWFGMKELEARNIVSHFTITCHLVVLALGLASGDICYHISRKMLVSWIIGSFAPALYLSVNLMWHFFGTREIPVVVAPQGKQPSMILDALHFIGIGKRQGTKSIPNAG
jgi:hypothetical protein